MDPLQLIIAAAARHYLGLPHLHTGTAEQPILEKCESHQVQIPALDCLPLLNIAGQDDYENEDL